MSLAQVRAVNVLVSRSQRAGSPRILAFISELGFAHAAELIATLIRVSLVGRSITKQAQCPTHTQSGLARSRGPASAPQGSRSVRRLGQDGTAHGRICRFTRQRLAEARRLVTEAIFLDQANSMAYASLAFARHYSISVLPCCRGKARIARSAID